MVNVVWTALLCGWLSLAARAVRHSCCNGVTAMHQFWHAPAAVCVLLFDFDVHSGCTTSCGFLHCRSRGASLQSGWTLYYTG